MYFTFMYVDISNMISHNYSFLWGAHSGAVGCGTVLQAVRSWVQFPMVSLEFFIDIILLVALWPWGSTQPLSEMSTRYIY